MEIQADQRARIVAVPNLDAMCDQMSSMCHRYTLDKVTGRYAYVTYSNPDEYGNNHPMTALYPAIPDYWGKGNPGVVLAVQNVQHDNHDGEGWQCFEILQDCPELFRSARDGQWRTREDIESEAANV